MNWKKTIATLAVAALAVIGFAAPASAHDSAVTGVATCEADGTYTVTWTYSATNVPRGREAETKAMTTSAGTLATIDGVLKGGQVFLSVWSEHQINVPGAPVKTGNWTAQFKTVGIPGTTKGAVTTMVQTDWKGGPSEDPVGKVTLKGDCTKPIEPQYRERTESGEWGADVLNCEEQVVTHTRDVWTIKEKSLDGGTTWTETSRSNSPVTETVRDATDRECGIKPPQPEPRTDVKTWQDAPVCVDPRDGNATVKTWAQDLVYNYTFDEQSWTWIEGQAETVGEPRVVSTETVTSEECAPEILVANPSAEIQSGCGYAVVTVSNGDGNRLTASVVIYVDGEFADAVAVLAGDEETLRYSFDEDSGDHEIVVRTGPAFGDEELASATVKSDCEAAPSIPTTPSQPTTPAVPVIQIAAPTVPQPVVVAKPVVPEIAHTGSETGAGLAWASALILAGLTAVGASAIRRRTTQR